MTEFFVTGVFRRDMNELSVERVIVELGWRLNWNKPDVPKPLSTPQAIAAAFGGNSRIVAAYAPPDGNGRKKLCGWIQVVHSDPLFQPSLSRLGMIWFAGSQINTNILLCLLHTARRVTREAWGDSHIHGQVEDEPFEGFRHDGPLIDDIRCSGGTARRVQGRRAEWSVILDTTPVWGEDLNRVSGERPYNPYLETENHWHLLPRAVQGPRIPKRQPSDIGRHTMG